jgi:hypothetical protein
MPTKLDVLPLVVRSVARLLQRDSMVLSSYWKNCKLLWGLFQLQEMLIFPFNPAVIIFPSDTLHSTKRQL